MKPKADSASIRKHQRRLIADKGLPLLKEFIDLQHPLALLAERIDWQSFEPHWNRRFSDAGGPKATSSRMAAGLLILKHTEALSDEALIRAWICNPYYQYFCGATHFQHQPPVYPSTMGRWRQSLGEEGLEYLLDTILKSAVQMKALDEASMAHVCVDSTVMEKAITWPTDSKLLLKIMQKMIALMQREGLSIRQSYARTAPRMAEKIGRYAHARQFKRMRRLLSMLATRVGRVARELERQLSKLEELKQLEAQKLLDQAKQILKQNNHPKSKNKLYSLHEPNVDCISKGKAHKRYEFGVKVGIVNTQKEGFVVGMRSYPGNPYDGHTLDDMLQQTETITGVKVKTAAVDLGYRGKHKTKAKIIHRGRKLSKREKKRLRRRSMIEAMIGHMKNDGLLDRCHLKGKQGDAIHALLCGIGHNVRLLLNFIRKQFNFSDFLSLYCSFFGVILSVSSMMAEKTTPSSA
ncbi:MAG: IS5 family transposase [Vibrio gallaecicus]